VDFFFRTLLNIYPVLITVVTSLRSQRRDSVALNS